MTFAAEPVRSLFVKKTYVTIVVKPSEVHSTKKLSKTYIEYEHDYNVKQLGICLAEH